MYSCFKQYRIDFLRRLILKTINLFRMNGKDYPGEDQRIWFNGEVIFLLLNIRGLYF